MSYEPRDNSGSLFRNDRATSDRHPSHKGQATIGGVDYWISGWVKESQKTGARFFSLAFELKQPFGDEGHSRPLGATGGHAAASGQGQARQTAPAASQAASTADDEDDIPF